MQLSQTLGRMTERTLRPPRSTDAFHFNDRKQDGIQMYDQRLKTVYIDFSPYVLLLSLCMPFLPMLLADLLERMLSIP